MTAAVRSSRETATAPVEVAYLLRSFPRLSQTFILSEVLMLEAQGIVVRMLALENSHEPLVQPDAARVRGPISYLSELLPPSGRGRALMHLRTFLWAPTGYLRALACVAAGVRHHHAGYHNYSGWRCLSFAATAARLLNQEGLPEGRVQHLHAHFAHDPALVALLVHLLTGISYSFTAHARDLYQIQPEALARHADKASRVITCCRVNGEYLDSTLPARLRSRVRVIHHGVDTRAFHPPAPAASAGRIEAKLVAVGRLVEKKGFSDLIRACHILDRRGLGFTFFIYGEGPQRAELAALIEGLRLEGRVHLMGSCTQADLVKAYHQADIFALTPFVAQDGDRDGIPNVVMEAMASSLPVLVTDVGGIGELVSDGANGLVATPGDVDGIAAGLQRLLNDADLRVRLGAAARRTVAEGFDARASAGELVSVFRSLVGASQLDAVAHRQDAPEMPGVLE